MINKEKLQQLEDNIVLNLEGQYKTDTIKDRLEILHLILIIKNLYKGEA